MKVLEAQMKVDLADKENLEARRAQHEEESRENSKLISEQKAVSLNSMDFCFYIYIFELIFFSPLKCIF